MTETTIAAIRLFRSARLQRLKYHIQPSCLYENTNETVQLSVGTLRLPRSLPPLQSESQRENPFSDPRKSTKSVTQPPAVRPAHLKSPSRAARVADSYSANLAVRRVGLPPADRRW